MMEYLDLLVVLMTFAIVSTLIVAIDRRVRKLSKELNERCQRIEDKLDAMRSGMNQNNR